MFLTLILKFSFTVVFMKVSGRSWSTPLIKELSTFQYFSDLNLPRSPHRWIAPVCDLYYNVASNQSGMTAYSTQVLRDLQSDTNTLLNNVAWKSACQAGVALHRRTRRGCRAGAHTRRRIVCKQTGVNKTNLLTIKPVNEVHSAKLCLLNARSVCNKADFIIDYVTDHDIDVLCITETWLQNYNTASVSAITPRGYLFEHVARSNQRAGGVGVLFRASFTLDHSKLWPASSFECIDIQLRCNAIPSTLRLFVIYRPPSSSPNSQPFATFLTEFRHLVTLLDKHGKEIQEQDKIMERIEEFYPELYDSDQAVTIQTVPKEVPPIMAWEVEAALRKMKNGKEAGKDQVNIETLKAGDETIAKQLAKLYTKCITERRIPKTWKEANMVIFFKKGNRKDIKNYRPICLLSNMYKLFTKIITTRLEKKLDENQPREQAGFRSKYSTTDHIHAINQLKEKCREYNIPLCVAFVDYEKAFDSVQTQAILTSLQEQGIEDVYIEILKDIYTDSSVTVHLHKESEKIRIKRGVRQGDTISPKLFTATLESIFRRLNWEHKGVKIDGEFLSNLRFADDIFLCTETPQELQQMLQELSDESRRMGLKMNIAKTKVMVVDNTPININNVLIENVQGYVYLGQHYSLKEKNQDKEIQRRIMAGWAAYAKHRDIFKSNLAICLKRQVYNSCVLPAMTYGAETWTLTKQAQNKLAAAQTKMERSMLNITYKDRKTNIWVRERTKVIDIINTVRKMKWSWAGHINRLKDDRWTSRVTSWRPYDKKRRQGRPAKRWRDDLDKYWSDTIWQRKAQDRVVWRQHAEAFAQPRDTTAA